MINYLGWLIRSWGEEKGNKNNRDKKDNNEIDDEIIQRLIRGEGRGMKVGRKITCNKKFNKTNKFKTQKRRKEEKKTHSQNSIYKNGR